MEQEKEIDAVMRKRVRARKIITLVRKQSGLLVFQNGVGSWLTSWRGRGVEREREKERET